MIVATAFVLMMTIPGLALFYAGMVRKKNVLATLAQSLVATGICSLLWFAVAYSLAFSGDAPIIGTLDRIFLKGIGMETAHPAATTIPEILFMMYQMTFAIITVALVAGSVADRMRIGAFAWFAAGWLLLVYVPLAHWVWGGGFLGQAGVLDFAGGLVVHLNAGVAGLVAAYVVGARRGYGSDNMAPFDLSLAVIGTGMLWVGWFGFNGGSALGAGSRASFAIVTTHLAACAGALTWMVLEWNSRGKPSVLGIISGAVAGLVAITPASGFVGPIASIIIGALAGVVCYTACNLKSKLGYDDSLDVVGVHGIGGTWGAIATGLFASKAINEAGADGLFAGNPGLLMSQILAVAATWVFAFGGSLI
ncbi:MAG: ammonium transporter, partial [Sphingomicrobium sp.]